MIMVQRRTSLYRQKTHNDHFIKCHQLRQSMSKCNHCKLPQSSEPAGPQQWTWGKFGQGLTEEEEGNCTPVFRAQLLNQLKQDITYNVNTVVRGGFSNLTMSCERTLFISVRCGFCDPLPLCSVGRLLKKVARKTSSLTPSSGQSPTL